MRDDVDSDRVAVRAFIDARAKCHKHGAPVTRIFEIPGLTNWGFCDACEAKGDPATYTITDLPDAAALRALLARVATWKAPRE